MKLLRFRKLAIGLATICFLIVSLVFSTYAFVIVNKEVEVDSFLYNIESDIGLWASLDGENYSQDISKASLVEVIEKNLGSSLEDFRMEGITPSADENGKLKFSDGSIMFKEDVITTTEKYVITSDTSYDKTKTYFVASSYEESSDLTSFDPDTTYFEKNDVSSLSSEVFSSSETKSFKSNLVFEGTDDEGYTLTTNYVYDSSKTYYTFSKTTDESPVSAKSYYIVSSYKEFSGTTLDSSTLYYECDLHEYQDVDKSKYISFDVWFKIVNVGEVDKDISYNLSLSDRTSITANTIDVTPLNDLTALIDGKKTTVGPKQDVKSIEVDPSYAIRLAVLNTKQFETQDSSTKTNGLYVFEKSGGLGSSAIENYSEYESVNDISHSRYCNAMYTYYNSTYPLYQFVAASSYNESYDTYDLTSSEDRSTALGTFTYDENNEDFNTIKLTISIYLEGWDADYLSGLASQSLNVTLGFKMTEAKS